MVKGKKNMKYYLVGSPMTPPTTEDKLYEAAKIYDFFGCKELVNSPEKIEIYSNYQTAREAALMSTDNPRPIFTVEYLSNKNPETLPVCIYVTLAEVEFISASFVHQNDKRMGNTVEMSNEDRPKIYYIKEEADPIFQKLQEMEKRLEQRQMAASNDQATTSLRDPASSSSPMGFISKSTRLLKGVITLMRSSVAITVGAGFWYFASEAATRALPATDFSFEVDNFYKKLGLSLLATGGAYLSQKLTSIKNLQKLLLTKSISTIISLLSSLNKEAPKEIKRPEIFNSPEEECQFYQAKLDAKLEQDFNRVGVDTGVQMVINTAFGDEPWLVKLLRLAEEGCFQSEEEASFSVGQEPQGRKRKRQSIEVNEQTVPYNLRSHQLRPHYNLRSHQSKQPGSSQKKIEKPAPKRICLNKRGSH